MLCLWHNNCALTPEGYIYWSYFYFREIFRKIRIAKSCCYSRFHNKSLQKKMSPDKTHKTNIHKTKRSEVLPVSCSPKTPHVTPPDTRVRYVTNKLNSCNCIVTGTSGTICLFDLLELYLLATFMVSHIRMRIDLHLLHLPV